MKSIQQILKEKGNELWLLCCLGFVGLLYAASLTLLTARMLLA